MADRSHELMREKNHLRGWRGWLAALFISVASLARAHDPGLSTAALKIFPDRLEAEVIFARADIEALVPLDANHDGKVSPEEWDRARPQTRNTRARGAQCAGERRCRRHHRTELSPR